MDSERIGLIEYQEWRGQLADEDAAYLATAFGKRISVRREVGPDGNVDVLNPNQHVGVLALPSGRRLEALPKVDVRNVFYMLGRSSGLPSPFLDNLSDFTDLAEILEFVALYFAQRVEEQIARGLYRSYVETTENLPFLRGRIVIAQDVRHNFAMRHRTFCEYTDFTWDIPENQLLRQVLHELSGWSFSAPARRRLAMLDTALAEVSPVRHGIGVLDRFQYHRHNDSYRELHAFCRLFLDGSSLGEQDGSHAFQTFLLDMNQLFESYVTAVAQEAFARSSVAMRAQWPGHLDQDSLVRIRPDLVASLHQRPILVADAKYKRVDAGEFVNHDLYQMLAYCVATGTEQGLLVYPSHLNSGENQTLIRNSNIRIERFSFQLGSELPELKDEEERLKSALRRLVASRLPTTAPLPLAAS